MWLTVKKELKIKDYPLNDPPPCLRGLSLVLGSFYIVLGSSLQVQLFACKLNT